MAGGASEGPPVSLRRGAPGGSTAVSPADGVDHDAVARLTEAGLVEQVDGGIRLTHRGRLLGDAVTAELIA